MSELGEQLVDATGGAQSKGTTTSVAMQRALQARWSGIVVFVSKETKEKLGKLVGRAVTKQDVKAFIEGVANGEYVVTPKARRGRPKGSNGVHRQPIGQTMSASEVPVLWTMQQVAKRLEVQYGVIYTRAKQGRIQTVREGKRWLVPAVEVARLEQVGL